MTKETKRIKTTLTILNKQAWDEESKRLIQYESVPGLCDYTFRYTIDLEVWLVTRGIAYDIGWATPSNVHPIFEDILSTFRSN